MQPADAESTGDRTWSAREQQLEQLLAAVLHLSAQDEVRGLLDALVNHARTLVRADMAYLQLLDEEAEVVRVAAVAGAVTGPVVDIAHPLRESPSAPIFRLGTPRDTGDDEQQWASDPLVAAERIVSVAGAPLCASGEVLAVLISGWRSPHRATTAEMDLLSRLGTHAAHLLRARRRADEVEREAGGLRAALEQVSDENEELVRFREAEEQLLNGPFDDLTLDPLTRVAATAIGQDVALFDTAGRALSVTGPSATLPGAEEVDEAISWAARHWAPEVHRGLVVAPVRTGDRLLGVLVVAPPPRMTRWQLQLVRRVALLSGVIILHDEAAGAVGELARTELLADLLTGSQDDPKLLRRAAFLGVDLRKSMCVLRAASDAPRKGLAESLHAAVARHGGLAATYQGGVVAILPGTDAERAAREVRGEVVRTSKRPLLVAGAGPVDVLREYGDSHQEALRCLRAMESLGHHDGASSLAGLGFVGLVLGPHNDPQRFVEATIGPLIEYDARRSSRLEQTLLVFLDLGGNATAAARSLHVHVNTVKQRLDRITELLGESWRDPKRILEIHLAVRLRRVLGT